MNRASHPALIWLKRTVSLSLRFTLFRTAAFPMRLLTKKPNRLWSRSFARKRITRRLFAALLPSRWIWENRGLPVNRDLRCITWEENLDRQLVASLESPSLQNCPAIGGAGTMAKSVHSGTTSFLGLIRAFWHNWYSLWLRLYGPRDSNVKGSGAYSSLV